MTMEQVGVAGNVINNSFASSAMNMAPDADRIRKYDTIEAPTRFMLFAIWWVTALMVVGTVYLFIRGHWIIGLLGLPVSAFSALVSYYMIDNVTVKEMAYKDGLITPAIIVSTDPIELIAMANMRFSEDGDEVYGCKRIRVESLPLHTLRIGEKVPCASLFLGKRDGHYKVFNTRPVCWGFDDAGVIERAIESVSDDDDFEFFDNAREMLAHVESTMINQPYGEIVLFDGHMQPLRRG